MTVIGLARNGSILTTDAADGWIEEAKKLMERGQGDEAMLQAVRALAWFRDAREQAMDDNGVLMAQLCEGRALGDIGVLHSRQRQFDTAITNFRQAIGALDEVLRLANEEDEDDFSVGLDRSAVGANAAECKVIIGLNLANAYAMSGDFEKAAEVAQNCSKMPFGAVRAQALHIAGMANAELGRLAIAVKQLEEARANAARRGDQELLDEISATLERLQAAH